MPTLPPTTGKTLDWYSNGKPAIIENNYGKGKAILIGLDVSHQCFKPGNILAENILTEYILTIAKVHIHAKKLWFIGSVEKLPTTFFS